MSYAYLGDPEVSSVIAVSILTIISIATVDFAHHKPVYIAYFKFTNQLYHSGYLSQLTYPTSTGLTRFFDKTGNDSDVYRGSTFAEFSSSSLFSIQFLVHSWEELISTAFSDCKVSLRVQNMNGY